MSVIVVTRIDMASQGAWAGFDRLPGGGAQRAWPASAQIEAASGPNDPTASFQGRRKRALSGQTRAAPGAENRQARNVVAIPFSALWRDDGNQSGFVLVVHEEGDLEARLVHLGDDDGACIEVIEGLRLGEILLVVR